MRKDSYRAKQADLRVSRRGFNLSDEDEDTLARRC